MATETLWIDQWLYQLLSGDATLATLVGNRIYGYLAPPDTTTPFVVYNYQGGHDASALGAARIFASAIYQVKAIDKNSSFANLAQIADRIDQLLQGASGSVANGLVLMSVREQAVEYVETDNGVQYRHLGGIWRILCRQQ